MKRADPSTLGGGMRAAFGVATRRSTVVTVLLACLAMFLGLVFGLFDDRPRLDLNARRGPALEVGFSPDGSTLASSYWDGTVVLWDVIGGKQRTELRREQRPEWLRRGSRGNDGDRSARVVDLGGRPGVEITRNGHAPITVLAHPDQINDIAISPKGTVFATAGGFTSHPWPVNLGADVRLWELESGRLIFKYDRFWGGVSSVAFSPDGRLLAAASVDGSVKVWSIERMLNRIK